MTITNSTFDGNSAGDSGGGAISGGNLQITNSTLAGNATRCGGGGISSFGSVTLQNTILALNVAENPSFCQVGGTADCSGPVTSLNNNVIGDPTGCTITLLPHDLTGDPGLRAFTDNGTPGNGHFPLLPTSQAIDAANDNACPQKDQIGHPRKPHCDIGAIECPPDGPFVCLHRQPHP
jgi:predicted outer membrane repeat protein